MSPSVISDFSRVLVTGGAGFVGRRLVPLLARRGAVLIVDDLSAGLPPPEPLPGVSFLRGDICDAEFMAAAIADFAPDALVHLAALHHIPSCEADPRRAMHINVVGFQTVLDSCARAGCGHAVLASSGAVYGWADAPLAEDDPLQPRDVYSSSKLANEYQLAVWADRTGGSGCIARLFNVIGPQDPNGHLIPDILRRLGEARTGEVLQLRMGNLGSRRDFVDVQDAAAGFAALLDKAPRQPKQTCVYNLCSGAEISAEEIARGLTREAGIEAEIVSTPDLRRPIDRATQLGNPARTAREVGWRATRSLGDSLADIVRTWRQTIPRP